MITTRLFAALALSALAVGPAMAVPYASKIRASETEFAVGAGTTISYILNESADVVTITIRDASDNVVATFAGTTGAGENTVIWNGRADNAAGAQVAPGAYTINISASKNNIAWSEVTSHQSAGNWGPATARADVYDGFSPVEMIPQLDTSSDYFGELYFLNSFAGGSKPAVAAIVFDADLTVQTGDGYDSRIFKEPAIDPAGGINTTYWGGAVDPDNSNLIYIAGQSEPTFWVGDRTNPEFATNADPQNYLGINLPRSVVVVKEGSEKYAYFTIGLAVHKAPMSGSELSGPLVVVASFASRYALDLEVDKAGNLYLGSRYNNSTSFGGGAIIRWDYATTVGPNPSLTEANAAWIVSAGTGMLNLHGPAISPVDGNVYALFATGTTVNANNGVYLIGNTSTPTMTKTLTTADRVVDFNTINGSSYWGVNSVNGAVKTDAAGNFFVMDRTFEQVRVWTPGGQSNINIPAPDSQALTITPLSSVQDWTLY